MDSSDESESIFHLDLNPLSPVKHSILMLFFQILFLDTGLSNDHHSLCYLFKFKQKSASSKQLNLLYETRANQN